MEYFAHSPKDGYPAQYYKAHIQEVVRLAKINAQAISPYCSRDGESLAAIAEEAAVWHDLGKLHKDNQDVLSGENKARVLPKLHWDAGAAYISGHAGAAIYSHHKGYPDFFTESNREERAFREDKEFNETDKHLDEFIAIQKELLDREKSDIESLKPDGDPSVFLRILLSCLVDADHTNTANHYGHGLSTEHIPRLRPAERLEKLNNCIATLALKHSKNDVRASLRNEMYICCRDANIADKVKISSCDSPVGSGKTTAVMAHLLVQAQMRGLRSIFVILPFTNIIQQSVKIYRNMLVLPGENPEDVVAELHHRADFESEDARHLTALWRAPIVVTTAVTFFETLASNYPATLRRLHELPGSAIFVDEAHAALPAKLLPIAWKWMNIFAEEWGCYWVLASGSLCRFWHIPEIAQDTIRTNVPEIVEEQLRRRLSAYESNRIQYRHDLSPKTIDSFIKWVNIFPGPRLVVVNTVNNAAVIASAYNERFGRGCVEHLSTALTPLDRDKTLARVKNRLDDSSDIEWTLIATSCVEVGVNLSFRTGLRELGSLASLLQVSGRVNREGKDENAEVWTFTLTDFVGINKNPAIQNAAEVLRNYCNQNISISHELCTDAISDEIKLDGVSKVYEKLLVAEGDLGFSTVKNDFKVIEADTRLVVVDPEFAYRIQAGKIDWHELQKNSVQIWDYKLKEYNTPEILEGIFLWNLGYDDFLGYMAGIVLQNKIFIENSGIV